MFDIGWQELFIIAALAIIVIGPKELPRVLRAASGMMRKARMIAAEFQGAINDAAHEADLDDIKNQLRESATVDTSKLIENTIDPTGDMRRELNAIERGADGLGEHEDPAVEEGAFDGDEEEEEEEEEEGVEPVELITDEARLENSEPDQTPETTQRKNDHG